MYFPIRHLVIAASLATGFAAAQEALRPEIGKPLQAAQELIKAGRSRDALAKLREADAIGNRSAYENYILERLRGSAATAAGDDATALRAFETVLASERLQPAERLQIMEALANAAYRAKNYAKAADLANRYLKDGGRNSQMGTLQASALYLAGDYAGVVRALQQDAPAADEPSLRMLAGSYAKLSNEAGYQGVLEKLLLQYPKKEYWADALYRAQSKPAVAGRLMLDLYRLRRATQTLEEPAQCVEMVELAMQAGLPVEARQVLEEGFQSGKLGTGPDAERHKRLRAMAAKQAADDEKSLAAAGAAVTPEALVNTGVALVSTGRFDKGIEMIEQGIAKGGLKRPEEARLRLGEAYYVGGNATRAAEVFKSVKAGDGTAELARLWAILALSRK